jgi:hypothetical protein
LAEDHWNPGGPACRLARLVRRGDFLSRLVVECRSGGIHGRDQIIGHRATSFFAIANPNPVSEKQDELPPEGLMENIQNSAARAKSPNLCWVSSQGGEDVAVAKSFS